MHAKFLSKHGIVRNALREDLLSFGLPALLAFVLGLVLSARDGYDGTCRIDHFPNISCCGNL